MSGVKERTIVITESELNNLRRRAAQATDLAVKVNLLHELQVKSEKFREQQEQRINNLNTQIANMGNSVAAAKAAASEEVAALRVSLQSNIKATNVILQDFMNTHQHDMQNMSDKFSEEIKQIEISAANMIHANNQRIQQVMNDNNDKIYADMNTIRSKLTADIEDVRDQVSKLGAVVAKDKADLDVLLEMAREYFDQASALIAELKDNFRVELLCPGRLDALQKKWDKASKEIKLAEDIHASAPTARDHSCKLMDETLELYQDVVMAEKEWIMCYQEAQQAVFAAKAQLDASREMDFSDENGTCVVDVEYWSNGELSEIERRLKELRALLDKPENISTESLRDAKDAGLQISEDIDRTATFAGIAICASQDRADVAQDIANSMKDKLGLGIVDFGYAGNDMRSEHRVYLKNDTTGVELVVSQSPIAKENGSIENHLESDIISFGALSTKQEDVLEKEIYAVLCNVTQLGFDEKPVQTVEGYELRASDRKSRTKITEFKSEKKPAPRPLLKPSAKAAN